MVNLIHANQARCQLKHVVPKRNNYELCILCPLLDIAGDNRNLLKRQLLILVVIQ